MTTANVRVRRRQVSLAATSLFFLVAASAVITFTAQAPFEPVDLKVGQVAPGDVLAPFSLTYESEVLTRLARATAADAVRPLYDPPDPSVLREQVRAARADLNLITEIRDRTDLSLAQKAARLRAISGLNAAPNLIEQTLAFSVDEWRAVDGQVITLLERVMRDPIRDDTLSETVARLPNLVSFTLSEPQAAVSVALAQTYIRPNAFYNEERTRTAKRMASEAVRPVTRSFLAGQIVVRGRNLVTEADMEALAQFNLLEQPEQRTRLLAGAVLIIILISLLGVAYLRRYHSDVLAAPALIFFIVCLFLTFLFTARLLKNDDLFVSRLYPAAAFAMIVVGLVEARAALAMSAAFAVLVGVVLNNSLEVAVWVGATSAAGVLTLRNAGRLDAYFGAGLAVAGVSVAVGFVFGLFQSVVDPARLIVIVPAGLVNGMLSAGLGVVGLYLGASLLNLPNGIKLIELSQPGRPLLQRLLREAPGTYQHSLQVANLAELAAARIGANSALVRVGALYHDIGKLAAPLFFVENQAEGVNPHEQLSPLDSARIIIGHVTEGEKLGRQHHLPDVLIDYILQHHGTTRVMYFYCKAVEQAGEGGKVDAAAFSYPGPRPQSREAAVLMLADASESIIRSKRTRDKDEITSTVQEIIQSRLNGGQLDDSGLTVSDLKVIQEVFVSSLQGVFHPRISYPATPRETQEMQALKPTGELRP